MIHFRISQLARELGVHRNTIGNWIRNGRLPARPTVGKRYVIEAAALESFCQEMNLSIEKIASMSLAGETANILYPATTPMQFQPPSKEVHMSDKTIGSVLVVGGGIAGIQASLDLANSGYFVHLVERSAGIGGAMAQLDKTFPTNDCAM
jgi:excisionase family DNA binding protein